MNRTVKGKLVVTPEDRARLEKTLELYLRACNMISKAAFENRVFDRKHLHHLVYHRIRNELRLPAALVASALNRVINTYKTKEEEEWERICRPPTFDSLSLDLYAQSFSISWEGETLSVTITACGGPRIKAQLLIGETYRPWLQEAKPKSAVLKYLEDGEFYLHINVDNPLPSPSSPPQNVVGVDIGMSQLIVASNGFSCSGQELWEKREKFSKRRRGLQRKGGKGKKALKRVSQKEENFVDTYLDTVSRRFINSLPPNSLVVMEDLRGIRRKGRSLPRKERGKFHMWAFRKLQRLIEYKAREAGHEVIYVDPQFTSQTCPQCGHTSSRNRADTLTFRCRQCGFEANANQVAAINLAHLGQAFLASNRGCRQPALG